MHDYAPLDADYFADFLGLAPRDITVAGGNKERYLFKDFCSIFNLVTENAKRNQGHPDVNPADLRLIQQLSMLYKMPENAAYTFVTLYMTMISEWYYKLSSGAPSVVKHIPKAVGIAHVLMGKRPDEAAKWSLHKTSTQICAEAKKIGIWNYIAGAEVLNIKIE